MRAAADLQTVLKRRIKALETHLPGAFAGNPRALHRARVASRRLREVLPLMTTVGPKATRRVRRLTRWLGRVREMDVGLQLLETDEVRRVVSLQTLGEARGQLQAARERRRERMLRRFERFSAEKLSRMFGKLLEEASREEPGAWKRVLATRLARRASAFQHAIEEAGSIYVAERLHGVRIAAKKLRYTVEIARELGIPDAGRLAGIVRRTQVTLGDLQDRNVLLRHLVAAVEPDAESRQGLAALDSELQSACRRLHAQFLSQRESLQRVISEIRQQIVPALAQSARRHTVLKATAAAVTHGRSHRALSDSTRSRRGARRRLA
jgi:CHAD domain-containing protein